MRCGLRENISLEYIETCYIHLTCTYILCQHNVLVSNQYKRDFFILNQLDICVIFQVFMSL